MTVPTASGIGGTELLYPTFDARTKAHYDRMVARNAKRDHTMNLIRQVRKGNMRQLFPSELNLNLQFEGVPIANFIDIVAKDMSELLAPLPGVACVSGKMKSEADQLRAEVKNRIATGYWSKSKLKKQMMTGADQYVSYGFLPFIVEPDVDRKTPYIQVEDPRHSYYELDRFGQVVVYAKRWTKTIDDLCAMFPEYDGLIRGGKDGKFKRGEHGDTELQLVRWIDRKCVSLFLPEREGLRLASYEHKLDRAPAYIAERPGLDSDSVRGQFDDVIWVQVARAIMTTLTLEAASTSVQAPIVLPDDMDELPVGPNAVYQTSNPQGAHRLNLELPPGVFNENATLQTELQMGSRYPDARSGNSNASVITGKGVEALLGSFTTQIAGGQAILKDTLEQITEICFEFDEKWWPKESKVVTGTLSGESYEFSYVPADDINGKYGCTVTYGFAAGMQPSQSVVTMLQLEGAGLIAKGTTMENMPFDLDQLQEQRKIDVENTREALKQGVYQLVQSIGPMAQQGQDPTQIIQMVTQIVKGRQDGKTMEDSTEAAFLVYQKAIQEQQAAALAAQQQAQSGGAGDPAQSGADPGAAPGGADGAPGDAGALPFGVAPGQAGMPAGGRPTVSSMIAGFRGDGNTPVLASTIQRKQATGTQ